MAIYPKQLQPFDTNYIRGDIKGRTGNKVIYTKGFTPASNVTVNDLLAVLNDTIYDIDFTGITNGIRTRARFRHFDSSFGDVVVYPGGVAMPANQFANEMIEILRVLYGLDHTVSGNRIGHAKSVLK